MLGNGGGGKAAVVKKINKKFFVIKSRLSLPLLCAVDEPHCEKNHKPPNGAEPAEGPPVEDYLVRLQYT